MQKQEIAKVSWRGTGRDKFISEMLEPRADDDEKAQLCLDIMERQRTNVVIETRGEADVMLDMLDEFLKMCGKFGTMWSHPQIIRCIQRIMDEIERETVRQGKAHVEEFEAIEVYWSSRTASRCALREDIEELDSEVAEKCLPILERRMMKVVMNTYDEALTFRDYLEDYLPVDKEYGSAERSAMSKATNRVIEEVDEELESRDHGIIIA